MDGLNKLLDAVENKIDELGGYQTNITSSQKITASKAIETEADLRDEIEEALDSDLAQQLVELAISEDDIFTENQFFYKEVFYDTELANKTPKEVAEAFFYGKDLDNGETSADPTKDYFRFNSSENIESTDYPGDIYIYQDDLVDGIIDFVIDHIDDLEFPEYIQKLVDEYLDNQKE